jgi:hypothetical protein
MKPAMFGLVVLMAAAATASAQPVETITSQAQREKDDATARHFVQDVLKPASSLEGQYARWKAPVCPHVYGLTPAAAFVIEHRIKEIGDRIGAPVDHADPCIPDIGIIFTADPQKTLDSIAQKASWLVLTASRRLTVTQPVETWYAKFIRDYNGVARFDQAWEDSGADGPPWVPANISRLYTGQSSEMGAVTVLIDTKAVTGMSLGTLADYVAFQTLSESQAGAKCQPVPSIANLMLAGCDDANKTTALSDVDIAMLNALYVAPIRPEMLQRQRIVGAMRRNLEGQH